MHRGKLKKAVTGNGNATKDQVEYMIKMLLSPPETHLQSDAYDALAIAVCDFYNAGKTLLIQKGNARTSCKKLIVK